MIEGIIKFNYSCINSEALTEHQIKDLGKWRDRLFQIKLVGEYPDKIGYGNISMRTPNGIIITASQTGGIEKAGPEHYVLINNLNVNWEKLEYQGPGKPSSESQTHLAIYATNPSINYVFHIHHKELWQKMLNQGFSQTSKEAEYGTERMAQEMISIVAKKYRGIIALGGHTDGIIAYGMNGVEAWEEVAQTIQQLSIDVS